MQVRFLVCNIFNALPCSVFKSNYTHINKRTIFLKCAEIYIYLVQILQLSPLLLRDPSKMTF
jgi:hypothetical protein